MSSVCTTINKDNYAKFDASYNPVRNVCVNADGSYKTPSPGGCTDSDYACYANYQLNQKRQLLDPQMAELYSGEGSIQHIHNVNYDSTMLSGVVWAMLGTTVLYYAFTKM